MSPSRILIVEDEPEIAVNLCALLSAKGHRATAVHDGASALARVRKDAFDLILLDVMLPSMSGFDVCKLLRAEPRTATIKIIMVTGLDRMADVEEAFRAGADDYLIKPIDSERLYRKIDKVLAAS